MLSRLPGAWRRASSAAVDIVVGCPVRVRSANALPGNAQDGRRRRERASETLLEPRCVARDVHYAAHVVGRATSAVVRGASAPIQRRVRRVTILTCAAPDDLAQHHKHPRQFFLSCSQFLAAAVHGLPHARARTREAPQHGVPGHVSAPSLPTRAAPAPPTPSQQPPPPSQRAGRHRRQRPIVALPLLWVRALLRLEPD